ncbi:MAG: ATP-binding protein [Bacteroidota bacterium]
MALLDDQNKWIRNFDTQDGLAHKEANRYSDLITQAGQVLIGSLNGLSVIDAKKAKQDFLNPSINKIYLTSVGFHDPKNGFQEIIWPNQLQDLGRITLPAKDRELTLSFAHSNYGNANLNRFSYRLCDDEEWTDIGGRNTLEFKDLRAGNHELWVQGYSMNGQATTNQIYLDFKVIPRFYESWWFYVFCIMSVLGIGLFWIQRLRWAVSKATATIEADKKIIEEQAEKLKELDAAKSRFFTNISHEFRTPLTIISGVADQLENKSRAELIRKNSNRLLRLINQILDLRKLEYSKVTFNMVQGNVVAYLSYLADTYATYTKNKNIDFSFIAPEEAIVMDYDPDKLADIISNLVSNALKHTQEGDAVSITIQTVELNEKEHCEITINDTGSGIPADKIPFIFDRFFKAETDNKRWDSTGIGLSLVQELVTNLGGQINVESQVDEGSVFTVLLPIELNATTHHDVGKPAGITRSDQSDAAKMGPGSQNTILIVEDHPDLIDFMRSILEDTYIVHSARDGFAGEERAYELVPDLIISDIMMPGQDGLELCEKLKNDRRTDHIPIILLTAMADIETKLEALQKRSDAFLGKPFDQAELKLTILNLLEQRAQLQRKYGNGASSDLNNAPKTPSDLFVDQLNEVIDQNLEKEGFSVPELCRGMALGRTQLHNKIKALTGRSTTGYIRYRRLLKARQLLKAGELNISEVAYATGFKSPNYFSTSFTDEFGMPPSKL